MRITDAPIDASVSTRTPPPLPYVLPPPPITLPPVPAAFVVAPSARARGQLPRRGELAFVPEAEAEVARLKDYVGIFGKTVPSQAAVTQALDSAFQWSTFRAALAAWEAYAQAQEVDAWLDVRAVLSRLKPALALAVVTDASIGQECPALQNLVGVRSLIGKRAAATRQANAAQIAAGLAPFKGKAGKRRRRAAENAALAAQERRPSTANEGPGAR